MTHDAHDARDDVPVDLSALWPDPATRSTERWALLVDRIEQAAAPELAARAERASLRAAGPWLLESVASAVARFTTPALVAAAAAMVLAIGAAQQGEGPGDMAPVVAAAASESLSEQAVRQALGAEPDGWLGSRDASDAEELVRAMYAGGGQE